MKHAKDVLQSFVSISQFNRGQASRIFEKLRQCRQIVVLKNNRPEAVILSPEEYSRLMEIEEDYMLMNEDGDRIAENGFRPHVSMEKTMKELGVTKKEMDDADDTSIG